MERFGHKTTSSDRVKRRAGRLAKAFKLSIESRAGRTLYEHDMEDMRHIIEREVGDSEPSFQRNCELIEKLAEEFKVCNSLKRLVPSQKKPEQKAESECSYRCVTEPKFCKHGR